jgi:hypothetical protein
MKALVYDYDEWVYDEPPIVEVENQQQYTANGIKHNCIWYNGGYQSESFKILGA